MSPEEIKIFYVILWNCVIYEASRYNVKKLLMKIYMSFSFVCLWSYIIVNENVLFFSLWVPYIYIIQTYIYIDIYLKIVDVWLWKKCCKLKNREVTKKLHTFFVKVYWLLSAVCLIAHLLDTLVNVHLLCVLMLYKFHCFVIFCAKIKFYLMQIKNVFFLPQG